MFMLIKRLYIQVKEESDFIVVIVYDGTMCEFRNIYFLFSLTPFVATFVVVHVFSITFIFVALHMYQFFCYFVSYDPLCYCITNEINNFQ